MKVSKKSYFFFDRNLLIVILICLVGIYGYSQNSSIKHRSSTKSSFASMISILDSTCRVHLENDFLQHVGSFKELSLLFQRSKDLYNSDMSSQSDIALNNAKIELLKREYGLELKAGYIENIDEGIFGPGDIYYNRRGKLEVEWNLLDNGFFENRQNIKELRLENTLEKRKLAQLFNNNRYGEQYNQIIYYFDQARIKTIEKYLSLKNVLLKTSAELYGLNEINWNEVLVELAMIAQLENKLKAYKIYDLQFENRKFPELDILDLPLVDIDLEKMKINSSENQFLFTGIDTLSLDYNPITDMNLSVYARYNIFGGAGMQPLPAESFSGREYFSVGLDLSVPLFFNAKRKQKIIELERKKVQEKWKNESDASVKEIYNHYYEYQFALQQYIQFYAKYLDVTQRIKRQTLLPKDDQEYSPRKLAKLLAERYDVEIALIDLKQKLYLKLLKLGSYVALPITDFVNPVELDTYFENLNSSIPLRISHIYMWSSDFGKYSISDLFLYLNRFSIKNVHVSISQGQTEKAQKFIKQAHQQNIKVFLLVGNNQLIFSEENRTKMESYFQRAKQLNMDGVHLDVEPQVFDDWQKLREQYQNQYVAMLDMAKGFANENGLVLSVSIPHYFEKILNQINQYVDKAFIMVYETDEVHQIQGRISEESSELGCKMVVSLRPQDFSSLEKLLETMKNLELEPCQEVALHDLKSLLNSPEHEK